jgi:hypothetical protein
MTAIHARNASIYIDTAAGACQAISGDLNTATLEFASDAPDVTGFGNNTRQRLSGGLVEWNLSISGFYKTASNSAACVLFDLVSGSTFVQFGPSGSASNSRRYSGCAVLVSYSEEYAVEDAITFSAELQSRSGSLTAGCWPG